MITAYDLATAIIRLTEGLRLTAYWDPTGRLWTIGYGHTKTAKKGMTITKPIAEQLLAGDCAPLVKLVAGKPVLEGAALISFGYNTGIGALTKLLAGKIDIHTYGRTSGGVLLPGLVSRRDFEAMLVDVSRETLG